MRSSVSVAWLTIAFLFSGLTAATQQRYTLHVAQQSLETLKRELRERCKVYLVAEGKDLKYYNINVNRDNALLSEILHDILWGLPLGYSIDSSRSDPLVVIKHEPLKELKGRVEDENGKGQPDAMVYLEHTRQAVNTDEQGYFRLKGASERMFIQVRGVAIQTVRQRVTDLALQLVRVHRLAGVLPRVTVTTPFINGLQNLKASHIPAPVQNIPQAEMDRSTSSNILDRVRGLAGGVLFDPAVGNSLQVSIRGRNTISGNTSPAIVLDNFIFPGTLTDINPNDIDTVTILKDPVSASIWGTYSANGVIVLVSKTGKRRRTPAISFTTSTSLRPRPNLFYIPQLGPASYIGMEERLFQQGIYDVWLRSPDYPAISPVVDLLNKVQNNLISAADAKSRIAQMAGFDTRTDLQRYFYRNSVARQYHLSISGGNGDQRYYLSMGYDHDPTNLVRNDFDRYTINANHSYPIVRGKLTVNTIFRLTQTNNRYNNPGISPVAYPYARLANEKGQPVGVNYRYNPNYIDTAGGGRLLDWHYYPLEELRLANNSSRSLTGYLQASLSYQVNPWLKAEVLYRWTRGQTTNQNLNGADGFYSRDMANEFTEFKGNDIVYRVPLGAILIRRDTGIIDHNLRGQLSFTSTGKGRGVLTAFAGAEVSDMAINGDTRRLYGYDESTGGSVPVDVVNAYPNYVSGVVQQVPGDGPSVSLNSRFVSLFSDMSFSWDQEYSFYGSLRRDATNIVGAETNRRWVPFWALGGGWEISRHFRRPSKTVPLLKVRIGYGCNGNIGNRTAYLGIENLGVNANGLAESGISQAPDPLRTWEIIYMGNAGVDFAFLQSPLSPQGRIRGSLDVYIKHSSNLLGYDTVPPSTGIPVFFGNIAGMRGRGFDLTLNSDNLRSSLRWNTTLQFSWATDRVTRYPVQPASTMHYVQGDYPLVGFPSTALFSYRWGGLDPVTGDPKGFVNHTLSSDYSSLTGGGGDLKYSGSYQPTLYGSLLNTFRWKGLSLSALFYYKGHSWFRRSSVDYYSLYSGTTPGHRDYDLRWQNAGDERRTNVPSLPAAINSSRDFFYLHSSVLATRGDVLRWQDFRLSYTWAPLGKGKQTLHQTTFFVKADNIGILWRANRYGIDPDAWVFGSVPMPRSFSLGFKLEY